MSKYKVHNDIHKYGIHDSGHKITCEPNAIFIGDNIDISGAKRSKVEEALKELLMYKAKFGTRFVPGNHELGKVPGKDHFINNKTCFVHGDQLFWDAEKRAKYYKKKPGASWFKRLLIVVSLDQLRKIIPVWYTKAFKRRAWLYATNNKCDVIVCGHKHPVKSKVMEYKGVKIVVLKRGTNDISVERIGQEINISV